MIGDAFRMRLSINAVEDMFVMDGTSDKSEQPVRSPEQMSIDVNNTNAISQPIVGETVNMLSSINAVEDVRVMDGMSENSKQKVGSSKNLQMLVNVNDTQVQPKAIETKKMDPLCRTLESAADYCEIAGDIRVAANSSTIFLVTSHSTILESSISSWIIQPYPRRGISDVKYWTVTLAPDDDHTLPKCTKNHITPAILFSMSGYSGNHFHDFADIILPLYLTSFGFKKDVHFLASDYKPWWPSKFRGLLHKLSRHKLVDIDREKQVHCYSNMVVGLKFYKELIVHPSSGTSMPQFRQFL
ncbi:hypothetical protein CDL12_23381 [Handroanthus impetiginosus]|uniref:Uncharacterized protein n=1 Tax=Handroanthus impetiginosus TaxID=429701 RepID=A0A2G9GFL8_9LAMI|nr:hypothetical protein CDL12_23381 [Handroanthus impetiginosus]